MKLPKRLRADDGRSLSLLTSQTNAWWFKRGDHPTKRAGCCDPLLMKSFDVHVLDLGTIDEQVTVLVSDSMDLGRAAQLALDEVIEHHGSDVALPVFLDIHPSATADSIQIEAMAARR